MFKRSLKIAGWLFLPFSILWILAAAFFWYQSASKQREWEKAPAVVTSVEADIVKKGSDGAAMKYAMLSFSTQGGQEYQVRSQLGNTGKALWSIGEKVEVIFPKDAPEKAEENIFVVQYILPLGISLTALLFTLVTTLLFWVGNKKKATTAK
ncbi:MAG: DUF3592 domain-containing protein [Akkermansia sp.]|nr:DUF3592 domain-containing protein [Bacteroidaceae bacterium]MBR5894853.1 DUF3592 domain-containing protein [Akkermansia sp.]